MYRGDLKKKSPKSEYREKDNKDIKIKKYTYNLRTEAKGRGKRIKIILEYTSYTSDCHYVPFFLFMGKKGIISRKPDQNCIKLLHC